LEVCCEGGEPLPPLKSKTTQEGFFCNGKLTASYLDSLSGTMCEPSMEQNGKGKLTLLPEGSPAKIFHAPEKELELTASEAVCGEKWRESLVKFDLDTFSWKTHQCLWEEVLPELLVTLPKWGLIQNGVLWERTTLPRLTSATESGSWPTPSARDWKDSPGMAKSSINQDGTKRNRLDQLPRQIYHENQTGGLLNPNWVEWLMGWPVGWTDLKPLETDKFQQWQRLHGIF